MASAVIHSIRERENFGLRSCNNRKDEAMNEPEKQQTGDSANNEVGPTEKLRESDKSEGELSVPGAQNPASEEIKDETGPNSE